MTETEANMNEPDLQATPIDSCRDQINAAIKEQSIEAYNPSDIADFRELNDYLDDPPISNKTLHTLLPEVETLLAVAWFVTEEAIRYATGKCSSTHTRKDEHEQEDGPQFTCQCCRYYMSLNTSKTSHIRRIL